MRRSWSTILLPAGLLGVLAVLGVLQYQWQRQINESEGEKARKRVQEQAARFAEEFNHEIQSVYFNLQIGAEDWRSKDWSGFNERYDFWSTKAAYPEMVADVYFTPAADDLVLRYDRTTRSFANVAADPKFTSLRAQFSDDKTFKPVYDDPLALVQPVHSVEHGTERIVFRSRVPGEPVFEKPPKKEGFLVITLDRATLVDKLLPELVARHFGDGEFRAAVTDLSGHPVFRSVDGEARDATARLFDLSPDKFMFFGNRELISAIRTNDNPAAGKTGGIMVNSHVESRSFNSSQGGNTNTGTIKIELKADSKPRTAVFTATTNGAAGSGPWLLNLQHSAGSLDEHLAASLRRDLAIGFGLLALLAVAIGAIIFSAQRAKTLAQRQVDFVSSVSHEFRTPLAVIYSAGENLADGVAKEDSQVQRYGNLIKGEGQKLSTMVEQILEFAGANSGRRKYNFVPVNVAEIVARAVGECEPLAIEKGFKITSDVPETLPALNADPAALGQAIQNLVVNSIKYSNGEKQIRVNVQNGSGSVRISVEDRGIGISRSDLKHIFEPFFRAKEVVDAQIHGNGLGLSLVRQIAEAHGGTVTAVSEPGRGSRFTIELPQR